MLLGNVKRLSSRMYLRILWQCCKHSKPPYETAIQTQASLCFQIAICHPLCLSLSTLMLIHLLHNLRPTSQICWVCHRMSDLPQAHHSQQVPHRVGGKKIVTMNLHSTNIWQCDDKLIRWSWVWMAIWKKPFRLVELSTIVCVELHWLRILILNFGICQQQRSRSVFLVYKTMSRYVNKSLNRINR